MKEARELSYEGLLEVLNAHDCKDSFDKSGRIPDCTELRDALATAFGLEPVGSQGELGFESVANQAVLGIDVYRYSQFEALPQSLVPFVVRVLYSEACRQLQSVEPYLFQNADEKEFRRHFIDAGDGGYQLLDTPIHAVVFALHFETNLRAFNSFRFYPRLRALFERDLSARYAITYDNVFTFQHNYYGAGIIKNARIIGRDRLNRCLMDQGTFDWFTRNTRGVENLGSIGIQDLQEMSDFIEYDASSANQEGQIFSPRGGFALESPWKDVDVLKIDDICVKSKSLAVYSLHVHSLCTMLDENDSTKSATYTVTLGNLNTAGINDS
ncbi:MAG TPA: hypothetical protein VIJ80_00240 [Candidatus Cryosericum sp.]